MKVYFRSLVLAAFWVGMATSSIFASAQKLYIAQNTTGSGSGADCADALGVNFFNTGGNWGAGTSQIGPGTTVHLCGTFTGTPGSTMLTVRGSGTSGFPITILFEAGAKFSAPYWGSSSAGAINLNGQSYITIDGGTNGLIENTDNGTGKTYQQDSDGIYCDSCSNDTVKNLHIENIYVRTSGSTDTAANNQGCIYFSHAGDNITIENNYCSYAQRGIEIYTYNTTSSNWVIANNEVYECSWGIDPNAPYSGGEANDVYVYGNNIHDNDAWWSSSNYYHTDGIFVRAPNGGNFENVYVYDNFIHGAIGHGTGAVYFGDSSNGPAYVFNNIFKPTSTSATIPCWGGGYVAGDTGISEINVYNNVFDGSTACGIPSGLGGSYVRVALVYTSTFRFKNNIALNLEGPAITGNVNSWTSDHNVWYGISNAGSSAFTLNGTSYSLSKWQSAGYDTNSTVNNPYLGSSYYPASNSSAIGLGVDLTNVGVMALNFDKAGNARPSSSPWDAGSYNYNSTNGVPPPSGLSAVPH